MDQLTDYLIKNNILCSEQFGFQSGYSSDLAALRLIDQMLSHLDACRIPLNIYIFRYRYASSTMINDELKKHICFSHG